MELTQAELKKHLNYDATTGVFTWLTPPRARSKVGDVAGGSYKSRYTRYSRISIKGRRVGAHRLAWLYVHGKFPESEIDHINGNGVDNRIDNLRAVSRSQNQKNSRLQKNNTSGISGVWFNKKIGKWHTQIKNYDENIFLGLHSHLFDAACARKSAERRYGFHENHGRR